MHPSVVWHTGCRPQEDRNIEPRHVQLEHERMAFPAEESKCKRTNRVIYLLGVSLDIITRLMQDRNDNGKLFRNRRGTLWTKFAICNRMHRLSMATGVKHSLYDARHGWATRKLIQGHDHLTLPVLLGHTVGSMLARVHSHLEKDEAHLKKALQGEPTISPVVMRKPIS